MTDPAGSARAAGLPATPPLDAWLTDLVGLTGAAGAVLLSVNQAHLQVRRWVKFHPEVVQSWSEIALSAETPLTVAVRTRTPVVVHGFEELAARFPLMLERPTTGPYHYLAVPLIPSTGPAIGVLGVSFASGAELDAMQGPVRRAAEALVPRLLAVMSESHAEGAPEQASDDIAHLGRGLSHDSTEADSGRADDDDQTRALLDVLILDAPVGIALLDLDLRYVRINKALADANGVPVADHLGRTVRDVLPALADDVEPLLTSVLGTGEPVVDFSIETGPTQAPATLRRRWRVSFYPVRGRDGTIVGVGLIVADETERWEAERQRAEAMAAELHTRQQVEAAQVQLRLLVDAGDVLSTSLDEAAVIDALCGLLVPEHADWLVLLLPDGAGHLVPARSVHADPALLAAAAALLDADPISIEGESPAAQVFRSQRSLVTPDVRPYLLGHGTPASVARRALPLDPGAGVLLPLVVRGRSIAVLSLVDTGDPQSPSSPTGIKLRSVLGGVRTLEAICQRAAVALDNSRLYGQRSRVARILQESLLPADLPHVPGLDIAVHYETAEEAVEVGGDFYDVIRTGVHTVTLLIGDVSGRGVDAAGVTGLARHTLSAVAHDLSPAQSVQRLNDILLTQRYSERFLTALCARLEHPPGETARLTIASGGHCRPLLVRADGNLEFLDCEGLILGLFPYIGIHERTVLLGPGDSLVLYTDGVTEARGVANGGLFGEEGLAGAVMAVATEPGPARPGTTSAAALIAAVRASIEAYRTGPAEDDTALLVVRLAPTEIDTQ